MAEHVPFDPSAASFEDLLDRLSGIVSRLESGELPLESALAVFEEGVSLAKAGRSRLDDAERRVDQLLADGDRNDTRPLVPLKESVE